MPTASNAANAMVGRGKVYFSRFLADGTFTGVFLEMGNCRRIVTTPEITKIELTNTRTKAATPFAEAITSQRATIGIEMDEYAEENVALALMGDTTAFAQTGGAITGEVLALAANAADDRTYFTAEREISAVTIDSGITPLVLGTDYEILDAVAGVIRILPGAPNFTAADLTIDYTSAAIAALNKVRLATQGNIKGQVRFIGDPVVGPKIDARWWNVSFTPDGEVDLLTPDAFGSLSISGLALEDSNGVYGGSVAEPIGTMLYVS